MIFRLGQLSNIFQKPPWLHLLVNLRSYAEEKNLDLSPKILFYLSEIPAKDDRRTHTAKLTGVLDQINSILSLKKKKVNVKVHQGADHHNSYNNSFIMNNHLL